MAYGLQADMNISPNNSPLGLRLNKTQAFLNLVQSKLSEGRKTSTEMETAKLKASNMSAAFIKIGNWEIEARHGAHLVAKFYYAKKKFVWEILDIEGALKRKIEIHWADVIGIDAVVKDNQNGILLIELGKPPEYYRESYHMPQKRTVWQQASDFTGGQAPLYRRHLLFFEPGVLDRHYEKLLQFDKGLFELSKKPFPTDENLCFYSNICGYTPHPSNFTGNDNKFALNWQHHVTKSLAPHYDQNYKQTLPPLGVMDLSSPTSERNCGLGNQMAIPSNPGVNNSLGQSPRATGVNGSGDTYQDYQKIAYGEELGMTKAKGGIPIAEIEQLLLSDTEVVDTDEAALLKRVRLLNSCLELGASSEVPPCEDDVNVTMMQRPSNQSFSPRRSNP